MVLGKFVGVIIFALVLVSVSAQYTTPSVSQPFLDVEGRDEIQLLIETYHETLNQLVRDYRFVDSTSPASRVPFRGNLTKVIKNYTTPGNTIFATIDGQLALGQNGTIRWYDEARANYSLRVQDHNFGSYSYRIIQKKPLVVEVVTTQTITGGAAALGRNFSSPSPLEQANLVHTKLEARIVYQVIEDNSCGDSKHEKRDKDDKGKGKDDKGKGKDDKGPKKCKKGRNGLGWLLAYRNEDYFTLQRVCNIGCQALASVNPSCGTGLGCTIALTNWNGVRNPTYPLPPDYVTLSQIMGLGQVVIYQ